LRLSITLPQFGPDATLESVALRADLADSLGFHGVFTSERVLHPVRPRDAYPPSPDGRLPLASRSVLDPLDLLAFVAARTTRILLRTNVLILPLHNPVQLARRVATLDVLSGGRASLGIGLGWSRDEYEAMGVPFEARGERCDECLRAMIEVWTKDPLAFEGRFYRFAESYVGPKPVQKPYPRIHVGGQGAAAHARASRFGADWLPAGLASIEAFAAGVLAYRAAMERAGSARGEVLLLCFPVLLSASLGGSPGAGRRPLMGTANEIREDIRRLAEAGVDEILLAPPDDSLALSRGAERVRARMELLRSLAS